MAYGLLKNILIYQGPGTSLRSVEALSTLFQRLYKDKFNILAVDPEFVLKSDWEEQTVLFVIPGGRSLKYYEVLGEVGNSKIRHYVESGGTYLGVCAGAYYAVGTTYFDIGGKNELTLHAEQLKLLREVEAIGPVYPGGYDYEGSTTLRAAGISILPLAKQITLYFNGGCSFRNLNTEAIVLAEYAELGHQPAMIKSPCGKGFVVLSGVHFEFGPETLDLDIAKATAAEKERLLGEQRKLNCTGEREALIPFLAQWCLPTEDHFKEAVAESSSRVY